MYKQLLILGISISLGALAPSAFATKNTTGFPAERGYLLLSAAQTIAASETIPPRPVSQYPGKGQVPPKPLFQGNGKFPTSSSQEVQRRVEAAEARKAEMQRAVEQRKLREQLQEMGVTVPMKGYTPRPTAEQLREQQRRGY